MDSAAALGWHVGPISILACDRTIAQARWSGVYRRSIVLESARLRLNSSVQKVYKFYLQQLKAAAQQVTPASKLYDSFHHTLVVTTWQATIIQIHVVVAPKPGWARPGLDFDDQAGPGRQKNEVIGPGRAGPKNFGPCRTV